MKFKIDENLPIEAAELLRQAGYDAITVYDQNIVGETDANEARARHGAHDEARVRHGASGRSLGLLMLLLCGG